MAFVLDATSGGATANSYLTEAEFQDYLLTAYDVTEDPNALADGPMLALATRNLNALYSARKTLVRPGKGEAPYYIVSPTWTGSPSTTTQALPWPRTGMYDRNGNAIAVDVIPTDLKNATAEFARQLRMGDRTLDNDVAVQGITSVKAGSVAVAFRDGLIEAKVIPDAVANLLVPSWLSDELIVPGWPAQFDVVVSD